jgi:hypothetical protein
LLQLRASNLPDRDARCLPGADLKVLARVVGFLSKRWLFGNVETSFTKAFDIMVNHFVGAVPDFVFFIVGLSKLRI